MKMERRASDSCSEAFSEGSSEPRPCRKEPLLFASKEGAIPPGLGSPKNMLSWKMVELARSTAQKSQNGGLKHWRSYASSIRTKKLSFEVCLKRLESIPSEERADVIAATCDEYEIHNRLAERYRTVTTAVNECVSYAACMHAKAKEDLCG